MKYSPIYQTYEITSTITRILPSRVIFWLLHFKKKLFEKKICNSSLYDFIYMVFFNKGAFKFYNLILIYEYRGPEFYKIMEL